MSDHEQRPPSPSRPQNVKPRPDGGKSGGLSLRVRRSLSVSSDQGGTLRRTRERHEEDHGRRRRRRSEVEAKRRDAKAPLHGHRKSSAPERRRASARDRRKSSARQDGGKPSAQHDDEVLDTECIVCFCSYDNVFKTPKLLACGHTFCLECLARINVASTVITELTCPVCRESTQIPHGSDLPQLSNNLDVFSRLPPNMQKALSVRFKRSKGKLFLRKAAGPSVTLPRSKKQPDGEVSSERGPPPPGVLEVDNAAPAATMIDVGQPPSRVRGRLRQMFTRTAATMRWWRSSSPSPWR